MCVFFFSFHFLINQNFYSFSFQLIFVDNFIVQHIVILLSFVYFFVLFRWLINWDTLIYMLFLSSPSSTSSVFEYCSIFSLQVPFYSIYICWVCHFASQMNGLATMVHFHVRSLIDFINKLYMFICQIDNIMYDHFCVINLHCKIYWPSGKLSIEI